MSEQNIKPEYDLTAEEISLVNAGKVHELEDKYLEQAPTFMTGEINPLTHEVYDDTNDVIYAEQGRVSAAHDKAAAVKKTVGKMYEEAYAANADPEAPEYHYTEQKKLVQKSKASKLLGKLVRR
jgi:hypothetical protein